MFDSALSATPRLILLLAIRAADGSSVVSFFHVRLVSDRRFRPYSARCQLSTQNMRPTAGVFPKLGPYCRGSAANEFHRLLKLRVTRLQVIWISEHFRDA